VGALSARLPPDCEAFGGDLNVMTTGRVRYPDATVVCGTTDPRVDTVEPRVVFEVLSPSSALTDRRVKAAEYSAVPSMAAYVLLEQDQPKAIVLHRADSWRETVVAGPDAVLMLPEIGVELSLSTLYG
jgi:Uma2 family endonuclease